MSEYSLFKKQSSYDYWLRQAVEEKRTEHKAVLERVWQQRRKQYWRMLERRKSLKSRYF